MIARLFVPMLAFSMPLAAAAQPLTQAEVEGAMAVLRADLYEMQDPATGGWYGVYDKSPALDDPEDDELLTVTATLALLRSGESPDVEPRLKKAVERVVWGADHPERVVSTQVVGTRAEIWPLLPGDEHEDRLRRDGAALLRAASGAATFAKRLDEAADAEDWNHRMTQYAVAGIAAAQEHDLPVPDRFWKSAAAHFIAVQAPSGGWSQGPGDEPNASMTCAGLSVLLAARAEVKAFVQSDQPEEKLEDAIARGLSFLDGELNADKNVYGGSGYLFFGLEQVAMRSGRRRLGGTEWFQEMGRYIIDRALTGGDSVHGQVVNASWFLTFLARGEVPVAFNKLTLAEDPAEGNATRGGAGASGRPNDVHFLTAWLSDTFESELNWQRVGLDEPVEGLLSTPASLLMLDGPWEPDEAERERLKRYLDLGGLLIVVPVGRSSTRVKRGLDALVEALQPGEGGLSLEAVEDGHPAAGLWRKPRRPTRFHAAGNGARTLVLLAGDDLGRDWQRGQKGRPGRGADDAMATGANLYLLASGYGGLPPRVASTFPPEAAPPAGVAAPVVAVVRCGGLAGREPALWEATRRRLAAEGLAALEVRAVPAAGFPWSEPPPEEEGAPPASDPLDGAHLLHLVGVGEEPAAPAVVKAAAAFAEAGGTVLVESLGGTTGFAAATEAALAAALSAAAAPLSPDSPWLSEDASRPGTSGLERVVFRPYSLQRFDAGTAVTLNAITLAGRPAVLTSLEDVSLGALGVRQWGVHGYGLPDAERLARNLVLHAAPPAPDAE